METTSDFQKEKFAAISDRLDSIRQVCHAAGVSECEAMFRYITALRNAQNAAEAGMQPLVSFSMHDWKVIADCIEVTHELMHAQRDQ